MAKSILDKTIKKLVTSKRLPENYYEYLDFYSYLNVFKSEELLAYIIEKLDYINEGFSCLEELAEMYTLLSINSEINVELLFRRIFELYRTNSKIFKKNDNFKKAVNAFNDKTLVLEYFTFLNELVDMHNDIEELYPLFDYIVLARPYYVDDRALLNSVLNLMRKLVIETHNDYFYTNNRKIANIKAVETQLNEDKRANGIYNIDRAVLSEIDEKTRKILEMREELDDFVEDIKKRSNDGIAYLKSTIDDLRKSSDEELLKFQEDKEKIITELSEKYTDLITEHRNTLLSQRETLIKVLESEIARKTEEFRNVVYQAEKRMEILRNANVTDSETIPNDTVEQSQLTVPHIIIPSLPKYDDRILDTTVNYFFDTNIPFQRRFEELMKRKYNDIQKNGAIYHRNFDDLVKVLMVGKKTPYMLGPSGGGKTYAATKQIANLFGINVVTDSYITFEQSVIGYTNSGTGEYVPTNFYRCYKYGDFYFLDEMDNGISNATIILNQFMAGNNTEFTFPDGITVKRHPNFRIIAAGNTNGYGRTLAHNTRQKLDESTLQRITPINFYYDDKIEKKILENYVEWYDFLINFRRAIENIPNMSGDDINIMGTITTRDAETIRTYLDSHVFNSKEIMLYEVIGTKDEDYLSKILHNMMNLRDERQFTTSGGQELLQLFEEVCKERKGQARCRSL